MYTYDNVNTPQYHEQYPYLLSILKSDDNRVVPKDRFLNHNRLGSYHSHLSRSRLHGEQ